MTAKTLTIEVDETTAAILEARAAAGGVSVSQFVAELAGSAAEVDSSAVAELERRWKTVEAGGDTVPQNDVVRWLHTWGKPTFRRWHEQ